MRKSPVGMCGAVSAALAMLATAAFSRVSAEEVAAPRVVVEASQSVHAWWTELAYFDDSPKAWDGAVSPEFMAALRLISGPWELRVEVGAVADRFTHFQEFDDDSLRAALALTWTQDNWTLDIDWEGYDVFSPGVETFYVGFFTYEASVIRSMSASIIDGLADCQMAASITGGYGASTFNPLDYRFAVLALDVTQPFSSGFAVTLSPSVEYDDYLHFSAQKRRDAVLGLKITPSYAISDRLTVSIEGEALFGFSTIDEKTGEKWTITPTLSLQTNL